MNSVTTTPAADDGPVAATLIVYVTIVPTWAEVRSAVLVTVRPDTTPTDTVAVGELLAGSGSRSGGGTRAVWASLPRKVGAMTPVMVSVAECPTASGPTVQWTTWPVMTQPFGAAMEPTPAGIGSVTVACATATGPWFVTVIFQPTGPPAVTVVVVSFLTIDRSAAAVTGVVT